MEKVPRPHLGQKWIMEQVPLANLWGDSNGRKQFLSYLDTRPFGAFKVMNVWSKVLANNVAEATSSMASSTVP